MLGLLVSGGVALWVAILSTPFLIRYFRTRQIGQHIREDGPATHSVKAGTPTMGGHRHRGVGGVRLRGRTHRHRGPVLPHRVPGVIGAVVAFGLIGFLDDYIKVHHRRSLGLNKRAKSGAQFVCALTFAVLAVNWAHRRPRSRSPGREAIGVDLGPVLLGDLRRPRHGRRRRTP